MLARRKTADAEPTIAEQLTAAEEQLDQYKRRIREIAVEAKPLREAIGDVRSGRDTEAARLLILGTGIAPAETKLDQIAHEHQTLGASLPILHERIRLLRRQRADEIADSFRDEHRQAIAGIDHALDALVAACDAEAAVRAKVPPGGVRPLPVAHFPYAAAASTWKHAVRRSGLLSAEDC
ncbi:MAG: hypothetical protein GC206_17080 [Alphaproteobacteria bacterium]|nr:hypothetical protein [Alphaproteobacteria bacterium]